MKTLLKMLVAGAAVAVVAFAFGQSAGKSSNTSPPPPAAELAAQAAAGPVATAGVPVPQGGTRQVIYVLVRAEDQITWAPAYYGPRAYSAQRVDFDPFSAIRVNPIPYPADYCAPSLWPRSNGTYGTNATHGTSVPRFAHPRRN